MYANLFPGTTVMEKYIIRFPLAPTGTDYGADANEAVWVDIPIILPWDVVESYSRAGKLDKWVRGLEYEQYNSAFWSNAMRMGWGRARCIASVPLKRRGAITPFFWHLDEVASYTGSGLLQQFLVVSWGNPACSGCAKNVRHYCMQFPKWRFTWKTNEKLASVVAWLTRQMMAGGRARHGYRGEVLADGGKTQGPHVRMFSAGFKTDWTQKRNMNGYQRWWRTNLICELDGARQRGSPNYADFNYEPSWATPPTTWTDYCNECVAKGEPVTPWTVVPGFLRERFVHDGMHALFKKGIASVVVAADLVMWCKHEGRWDGANFEERLLSASKEYRGWLRANHLFAHRSSAWTPNRLGYGDGKKYPIVSDTYKCGDLKLMLHWCAHKHVQFMNQLDGDPDEFMLLRCHCTWSLSRYVFETSRSPAMLSEEQGRSIGEMAWMHLRTFAVLSGRCCHARLLLYKPRPKHHVFHHIALLMQQGNLENPKLWENWMEEDLMGKVTRVNKRLHAATVLLRAADRYSMWVLTHIE